MTLTAAAPTTSTRRTAGTVTGTAVVYNTPTTIGTPDGAFDELVAPGALQPALQRSDAGILALLRDHDPGRILARLGAGTLKVLDDSSIGLRVIGQLAPTELGAETATLVARGDLRGMSFSFMVAAATWHEPTARGGNPVRVITAIARLFDVSVVTFPAYPTTTVAMAGATPLGRTADRHLAAARARHDRHARILGPPSPRYGAPMRRPPADIDAWARGHPVRRGTEARRAV